MKMNTNPRTQKFPAFVKLCFTLLLLAGLSLNASAQSITAAGYAFSAHGKTFSYLTGGTRITTIEVDDGYTSIPLGFTFTFCGVDYTDVTVCSNGWLIFGTTVGSSANWNYNAVTGGDGIAPAVFALYEDISGVGGTSRYDISGTAGSKVFTWECRDWKWDFDAPTASVSFQVKLYEATGIIEVLYKQELGAVVLNFSGGATIGIANSTSDWQVLDGVGASPTSSSSTWKSNLSPVPATGQSYMWDPGPPCHTVTPITVTNYNSTSMSFNWTAVSGSLGYEYAIDFTTTAAPATATPKVATTANSIYKGGLKPATMYYIHVRNKCGATNYSKWEVISVETRPECSDPKPIIISRIDSTSIDFQWPAITSAIEYQYIIDQNRATPASASAAITQPGTFISQAGLVSGELYYVHYRSLCAGNDSSAWSLDSFRIPMPCRKPVLNLTNLTPTNAIVYWSEVPTAVEYEYYLGNLASPPPFGTPVKAHSFQAPYLSSATQYNVFVRCKCDFYNMKTTSDWAQLEFMTPFPLSIGNAAKDNAVAVYPNPVHDVLNITVSGRYEGSNISITDVTGRVVKTIAVTAQNMAVDMKGMAAGTYFLKYNNNNNQDIIKLVKE